MLKTVKDLYNQTLISHTKLLSSYPADFWADYRTNSDKYDALFKRKFKSFIYFDQEEEESTPEVLINFTADVYNHLLINDKRYTELFRIASVSDEDYDLLNNYNMTETMDRDTSSNNINTYGQRQDSQSFGQRQDSQSFGQRQDSESIGSRSDSSSGSNTNKVAPFNSNAFNNNEENTTSDSFTLGAQSNSSTIGSQSNSMTIGSQSNSMTKGAQSDTINNTGTEDYTLTRKGNIGVMTGTDMLEKHNYFWNMFNFYDLIFRDIAKELLHVGGDLL